MLQNIKRLSLKRPAWFLLILSCLSFLGVALYFQYGMNLQPCIKCIYIRAAFAGVLLAGIIGFLAPSVALVRVVAIIGATASALFGIYQANELMAIERLINDGGFFSCSLFAEFPSFMPLDKWLPSVFEPTGSCGTIDWQFLGKSMAFWSAVSLLVYAAIAAILLLAQPVRISNNPYRD